MALDRACDLLAIETAAAPDQACGWIGDLVRGNAVRLRDTAGRVMRYSETPEFAGARELRSAQRQSAPRYNPHSYAARRRSAPSSLAPRPPAASDQVWTAGYAVHLGDLERALVREFEIHAGLCAAAASSAVSAPATGGPIEQLVEFFKQHGREPEFQDGAPRDRWKLAAVRAGLLFADGDFDAGWRVALERGHVVALKGAPARDMQSKRAPQEAAIAPARKATGT